MNKKNLILAVILMLLVAISYIYQGPMKDWKANSNKPDNFLAGVNIDEVNIMEITKMGKTTRLVSENNRWKIDGTSDFYVEDDIMTNVITALKDSVAADVELVSENPEKKAFFQVNEMLGNKVKLMNSDSVVVEFVIGKVTSDFKGSFVSMADFPKTYSLAANLRVLDRSDWYDKNIFNVEREKINKIRFQYPTREFTTEKTEDKWSGTLPYKFSVSDEKIDTILDIMTHLVAAEIPEQSFEGTGLEKNNIIIEVTGEEDINYTIMIGDAKEVDGEESELYYVKKGDSDNIYLIKAEQVEELDKHAWQLK